MFEERIFATANGARFGTETYLPSKQMDLDELDTQPGFVDYPADDGGWNRVDYDSLLKARLAFGLWRRVGPYRDPAGQERDPDLVPLRIAGAAKADLVAYLLTLPTGRYSKRQIADILDVKRATVRNHAGRARTGWGEIATLPDRVMFTRAGSPIHYYADLYAGSGP